MLAALGLGELLWSLFILFLIVQLLLLVVMLVADVVRSPDLSGVGKAMWLIALLLAPFITLFVYLIARGDSIGRRTLELQPPPTLPPPAV